MAGRVVKRRQVAEVQGVAARRDTLRTVWVCLGRGGSKSYDKSQQFKEPQRGLKTLFSVWHCLWLSGRARLKE